jgi:DNA-binding response OmpR family regulator
MLSFYMFTIKADPKSCILISDYLKFMGKGDLCSFVELEDESASIKIGPADFAGPVRIGAILDHLQALKRKTVHLPRQILEFSGGTLDVPNGIFMNDDTGQSVKLTEKEVAILAFLHAKNGASVQKQELLSSVWEYAESAETHTLETHIYRLRQKIESDPTNPSTLITCENGYRSA